MSKLVIVESPSKAKTIQKYLGPDYEVIASMGHVRDLPKARLSVDVKDSFKPKYSIIKGKEKLVKELKEAAAKCDGVLLATDPDREGEAISWHLAYILDLEEGARDRVTFNEITKTGVAEGMAHPRAIDLDLVNAQQARRILDRLVGYTLSPFLAKTIRPRLSAGRVQSVAVRMIVDREEEIKAFVPEEYWSIDAKLTAPPSKAVFAAAFYGDENGEIKIGSQEESDKLFAELEKEDFVVGPVKKGKRNRQPAPPFITSTLQQEASRKLGFQARRTMKAAQELYEGVDVEGLGTMGLITYMRTDSLRISEDAIREAGEYIEGRWGKKYLPAKPRHFKSRANAQDGHEAIRPSTISLTPEQAKSSLTSDQYKLYKLIWERFIACQMANCVLNTSQATILAGKYIFKASGFNVHFDGFTALYEESKDEEEKAGKDLPPLEEGQKLKIKDLKGNQHFTQPPPRYTEASLIKTLEENGIGRPSTYAATISTITTREYVAREGKAFKPTELGEVITKLMKERFPKIVNVRFTAQVEDELDAVQRGDEAWVQTLQRFYDDFDKTVQKAKKEMDGVKIKLKEDETGEVCEKCGKPMVIKYGRYGRFMACSGYPECKNVKKIVNETGAACPKCGGKIIERKSKKGRVFYGCSEYPKCDFVSWDPPSKENCPVCGKVLLQKKTKDKRLYCVTEGCTFEGKLPAEE
ncbi:type I DNA topoisomerase [Neglecta sp. X4]|uniref:type I DNA topoisomerase n=1 Tax=unclassified Neglectibacter TaxID=2632164 RepID=UPI00136F5D75|nr:MULTISPECIES: type I DNA topoisomerase [unclassified Neglectibacter]NBI18490.1 type I DNA topoisomerase [Neglectibacter sp. 59]NBJ73507.1 type I DNA topoisomerase [Neglectibacter sp. X4]NCE81981.1 type I DNA topoisomerase [Neglectibacter sp. X58]